MLDREKIIEGLECHKNANYKVCLFKSRIECPYFHDEDCRKAVFDDAISILKEQKAEFVEIIDSDGGKTHWYLCGGCKSPINPGDRYCHECGKAVKWNDK